MFLDSWIAILPMKSINFMQKKTTVIKHGFWHTNDFNFHTPLSARKTLPYKIKRIKTQRKGFMWPEFIWIGFYLVSKFMRRDCSGRSVSLMGRGWFLSFFLILSEEENTAWIESFLVWKISLPWLSTTALSLLIAYVFIYNW